MDFVKICFSGAVWFWIAALTDWAFGRTTSQIQAALSQTFLLAVLLVGVLLWRGIKAGRQP